MQVMPSEHTNIVIFEDVFIALDTINGVYSIFPNSVLSNRQTIHIDGFIDINCTTTARSLVEQKILRYVDSARKNEDFNLINPPTMLSGGRVISQRTCGCGLFHSPLWKHKGRAALLRTGVSILPILRLSIACIKVKIFGFCAINNLQHMIYSEKSSKYSIDELVGMLESAIVFCPFKVECLQWSVALHGELTRNGYMPRLVIGVRAHPFTAHAWIEDSCGRVIGDHSQLRRVYAVIFETAARRQQ